MPDRRQHFLKPPSAAARAQVVAAQLLEQLLVTVDDPHSALHPGLGRIAAAALAGALKSYLAGWSSSSPLSHPPLKELSVDSNTWRLHRLQSCGGDDKAPAANLNSYPL